MGGRQCGVLEPFLRFGQGSHSALDVGWSEGIWNIIINVIELLTKI